MVLSLGHSLKKVGLRQTRYGSAYEEQQMHLEAEKEQIAARRRYIDSGGLEEEINTELERLMEEVELEGNEAG